MIRRNDLVKQFEDVVTQEIVNHNRAIEASNQSIQAIRDDVGILERDAEIDYNALDSRLTTNEADLKGANDRISSIYYKLSCLESNFDREVGLLCRMYNILVTETDQISNSFLKVISLIQESQTSEKLLAKEIKNVSQDSNASLIRETGRMKDELQKLENRLASAPNKADQVKEELEKQIAEKRVDFDGVTKELLSMKHKLQYAEKKIEDLYTQLGRKVNGAKL